MATQIVGADELKRRLRNAGAAILPDIATAVLAEAREIQSAAASTAPQGPTGQLAASGFVDGAEIDEKRLSAGATVGYEAPYSAWEHEGYHFGRKIAAPPKWLERAAQGRESSFAARVGDAIRAGLEKLGK